MFLYLFTYLSDESCAGYCGNGSTYKEVTRFHEDCIIVVCLVTVIHRVNTHKNTLLDMQKKNSQAPDIILFCNNKKAYIPYLYLNGRSVAKKTKYV